MSIQIQEGQIKKWIDIYLEGEDITNYKLKKPEILEKNEGFATIVIFVNIIGSKKSNGENIRLNLAFKVSRIFKGILQNDFNELYKKEFVVYEKIFPEFRRFTKGKRICDFFQSVPHCFKTFTADDRYIVVLNNLRLIGYEPHDRQLPMNLNHIKLILKNYAKLHAISFCFRDQKPKNFENLVAGYSNVYMTIANAEYRHMYQENVTRARDLVKEVDDKLAKKLDTILEKGAAEILDELFGENVKDSVITHGDCWNCNFLFKYGVSI